jgi:hypothetical protein
VGKPTTVEQLCALDVKMVGGTKSDDVIEHHRELLQMIRDRVVSIEIVKDGDLERVRPASSHACI